MATVTITYAGHSAVFFEIGGIKVAIDPWLKGNPLCPDNLTTPNALDLIVLTHGHADHASDAARVANITGARLAATYELAMIMVGEGVSSDKVIPMNKGGSVAVDGVTVCLTNAFHSSSFDTKTGPIYAGEPCGVVLSDGTTSIYHAGDTDLFSDMKLIGERFKPTVSLLPIGDRFTMGPDDAATAASWLQSSFAIPIHYKTFPLLTGTYDVFAKRCESRGVKTHELSPGESLVVG
jgi:L-ascorbate metabolism protein UlaG (beta-lactamase superfamily)